MNFDIYKICKKNLRFYNQCKISLITDVQLTHVL